MPAGEVVDGWLSEAIEVVEVLHRVWRAERLLIHSATAVPMTEEVGTAAVVVLRAESTLVAATRVPARSSWREAGRGSER